MRKFGLIGYPLGHSFSKKYFAEKFLKEVITDCIYENYPIDSIDRLPSIVNTEKPDGLNVTIPYKSSVIRFLDGIDSEASEIGAVNVIKIKREGDKFLLYGYNSDITGILDTLEPFSGIVPKSALVLGSGGSSRAVCHVLKKMQFKYSVVSRVPGNSCLSYGDLTRSVIQGTGIIINTTPLGMYPDVTSKPPLDYDLLTDRHVLFDLVYNPEITSFLDEGRKRGCTVLTGLTMLYSQAERSWQIWNDPEL